MQRYSKTKGGLQDFASLTTLKGFTPFTSDMKQSEQEEQQKLSKATANHFQQRTAKLKKCDCKVHPNEKLLLGWELYKPRKFYAKTNQLSRSNSTDVLRHLLMDQIRKKNSHGRPTALTRLIDGMRKPAPKPEYKYGNCLQETLTFDDHKMEYRFEGKLEYTPPDIDEIYLNTTVEQKPIRKNPFAAVQLCPTSLYNLLEQPLGLEYVSRGTTLIDPKAW